MLHEIFKGMDNAAEVINENFLFGSIVEDNLSETEPENGYYVRFGNGLQIIWADFEVSRDTPNPNVWMPMPIESISTIYAGVIATDNASNDIRDTNKLTAGPISSDNRGRVVGESSDVTWFGTGILPCKLFIISTWK